MCLPKIDNSDVIVKRFATQILEIIFPGEKFEPEVNRDDDADLNPGEQKFKTTIERSGQKIAINITMDTDGWGSAYTDEGEKPSRTFIREGHGGSVAESTPKHRQRKLL